MLPILSNIKISRLVVVSGILTFLYLIELCIGARTVYYVFYLWINPSDGTPLDANVSWTLCVACLLTAAASSFVVNFISAIWEQKQLKEAGKEKSVLRFTLHLLAGGMLWRYVAMWFSDNEEHQKRQALLLTMAKFLFTQFFTIPLVIVHTSLLENLDELVYDTCSILCISFNLLLTCIVFSWGKKLVSDLKKWNYETIDLVPLIFSQTFLNETPVKEKNPDSKEASAQEQNEVKEQVEESLVRLIVFLQTFFFSFGRLLALGILLKLAGIYAVSIMFLQLLASVIYLKFQVPILVSDSLQKWRQLTRLAFMSYILIFEWHLNRDSSTGYDFDANIKHSIIYYSVATIESVFYLVTWAVTTSFASNDDFDEYKRNQAKFPRIIIIIGSLTLVFSLLMHLILLMWRSRKISTLMYSVQRKYACFKMSLKKSKDVDKYDSAQKKQIEISNPIPINSVDEINCGEKDEPGLDKHNSYKDLREPLDDEIEIYSREKCSKKVSVIEKKVDSPAKVFVKMQQKSPPSDDMRVNSLKKSEKECNSNNTITDDNRTKSGTPDKIKKPRFKFNKKKKEIPKECDTDKTPENKVASEETKDPDVKVTVKNETPNEKSKVVVLSETFSDQWNKLSLASQKFSGTIREQFQKGKSQLQTLRNGSNEKSNADEKKRSKKRKLEDNEHPSAEPPRQFIGQIYSTEGYFVGDAREQEESVTYPVNESNNTNMKEEDVTVIEDEEKQSSIEVESLEDDVDDESDPPHRVDGEPCPCFICKSGNTRMFRRRSSSVPPPERKKFYKSEILSKQKVLYRYPSNPTICKNNETSDCDTGEKNDVQSLSRHANSTKRFHNLSLMSLDRVEHYV